MVVDNLRADGIDERIGLVNDVDGHEMVPSHFWGEVFGSSAGRMAEDFIEVIKRLGSDVIYDPDVQADDLEINRKSVWEVRGSRAPGAIDFSRRVEVLDVMGIDKQLLFPSFAVFAAVASTGDEDFIRTKWGIDLPMDEVRSLGRGGIGDYNSWAASVTALAPDRLRPVGYVVDDGSVSDLLDQTRDLVNRGIRAINVPAGAPPGGVSPADPALDPFWDLVSSRDIPVVLHIGGDRGLLASGAWGAAPAFAPGKASSLEVGIEPYSFATIQFAPSNFLTAMTLGGVFERFPNLRFGVLELGCTWFGPLAENLDMWASEVFAKRLERFISMKPSEYFARNVRVTPFNNFEPIERELERYPYLRDCYCYSSDYPHLEGGRNSKEVCYDRVAPLGEDIVDQFFVRNSQLLLPD